MDTYDYRNFTWKQDDHNKLVYKRQPSGGELIEDGDDDACHWLVTTAHLTPGRTAAVKDHHGILVQQ